jgi:7-carboxy-7-deazaguanine synthase
VTPVTRIENFLKLFAHRAPKSFYFPYIKVVVFDDADYEYAKAIHRATIGECEFFISVGNSDPTLPTVANPEPLPGSVALTREEILNKTRWLFEKMSQDPDMRFARVMPQLHALAWGNERGR